MRQAELVHARNDQQVAGEVRHGSAYTSAFNSERHSEVQGDACRTGASHSVEQIDGFMAHLLQQLGQDTFSLWFSTQTSVRVAGSTVVIEAPSDFLADCIKTFCQPELNHSIRQVFGAEMKLSVGVIAKDSHSMADRHQTRLPSLTSVKSQPNAQPTPASDVNVANAEPIARIQQPATPRAVRIEDSSRDCESQTQKGMPTFFVGSSNRLAATAADMVIDKPGELGLLFIYGPNGVGKTHLCRSLRERLKLRHGLRRVMYMTAEQFTIDFSESTRGAGFAAFRKKYRDVDGLILDDAQFFLGKHQTLAELRNTIDDLLGRRRQIVMTADRPLSELVSMGSDLHARLSGGVSCCLEQLDVGLRRMILEDICKRHQVELATGTLDALANQTSGDGRALYGLVFRLLTQQRVAGCRLTHEQALACTHDLLQASRSVVRLNDIERVVCDSFGLEPKALRAKTRSKSITAARMLAMFLARKHTAAAFAEIGEYFGNRQHSTVISAQKRVNDWLNTNEPLAHRAGMVSIREWVRNAEASLRVG